ncbi:MAG: hypothetical protein LUH58_05610 [Lachnospiraceae bacterium]|nr:hypothetical protein [Lachnospiraceae bacterium]
MKYNILTFLAAALMVAVSTLALSSGMWIYEQNQLDTEEMRTPTTISNSIGTIYSNSAQDDETEVESEDAGENGANVSSEKGVPADENLNGEMIQDP